jgi:hypothetical protein
MFDEAQGAGREGSGLDGAKGKMTRWSKTAISKNLLPSDLIA